MEKHRIPSLKHLSSKKFFKPPKHANECLEALGAPHVESFNFLVSHGLKMITKNLEPIDFELPNGEKLGFKLVGCNLQPPTTNNSLIQVRSSKILPTECRQRHCSYKGSFSVQLKWWVNGEQKGVISVPLGELPVMVKSALCHTWNMTSQQLVDHGEEEDLWGGYFIIKGHERLIRMLIQNRSNYPIVMQRRSWTTRGNLFSELGVMIRCVADDMQAVNNVLHFVNDGSAKLMFGLEKNMYLVPLILVLKCFLDVTDEYIYQQLLLGAEDDHYYKSCVCLMLRRLHEENIHCQNDAKIFLGQTFRIKVRDVAPWATDIEVCDYVLRQCILIQFKNNEDKFHLLCLISRKLFAAKQGRILFESVDQVMMQEVQLGGYLYLQYLKECLTKFSRNLRLSMIKKFAKQANPNSTKNGKVTEADILKCFRSAGSPENAIEKFLATGNVVSISGLAMMQDTGLTIVAENINRMRYMSHFRAVHRGSFFAKMRTTDARQLLPDAWGFICPVHTPDGSPCGLLNHLARHCRIVTEHIDTSQLPTLLGSLGMTPLGPGMQGARHYFVTLDSKVLGAVSFENGAEFVRKLRQLKTEGERVSALLEIAFIPHEEDGKGQYPGIFLFSNKCRMMRPVLHLATQKIEMVGTLEQIYLNIVVAPSEIIPGITSHLEISETTFLSNLACMIPMPDCNQSPRNMYQCQMGKQSMGTPTHTWSRVPENKVYRLQTPSSPLFKAAHYDALNMDAHPMGVNAVVAVISYTGYDMEDAMVINKSSYERGFAHGSIYKTEYFELDPGNFFAIDPEKPELSKSLDQDGLPYIGSCVTENQPAYCYFDAERAAYQVRLFKGKEDVYVDRVKAYGTPIVNVRMQPHRVNITYRIPRNPSIGDKFASRAGQKGICSQKWPTEDLPFTESGLVPDIVFNPHGFPSRMTIAMMIELMAGKSAAMHGLQHDATPFRFNEQDTAIDYFGKLLQEAGYNYYGNERMYSGIDGREMNVDIFFGIVYYQRLRHMVSDKWQVRSTGPVDQVTHQPLQGRKRGGGVRFGEMERDALISHGASFLLQDRLLNCSDKSLFYVCRSCGSLLSSVLAPIERDGVKTEDLQPTCRSCKGNSRVEEVEMPHVTRLLAAQLAAINIKLKFELSPIKGTLLTPS